MRQLHPRSRLCLNLKRKDSRTLSQGRLTEFHRPNLQVLEIHSCSTTSQRWRRISSVARAICADFSAALRHELNTPLVRILGDRTAAGSRRHPVTGRKRAASGRYGGGRRAAVKSRQQAHAACPVGHIHEWREGPGPDNAILARLAPGMAGTHFAIAIFVTDDLPCVAMRSTPLETIASALIENAGQAGATKLHITGRSHGKQVHLDFVNDGSGVPMGDRDRIFDPFLRQQAGEGRPGLGLTIACALISNGRGWLELVDRKESSHVFQSNIHAQSN